ncbi:MAG: Prolyl tripeptidyl peptidase precursor, partial [Bacteroidota bacterium]
MKRFIYILSSILLSNSFLAQENLDYQKPPKEILDLVDYERAPSVIMDSKKLNMVFLYRDSYKTLDDLNQEEMKLAGLRINPVTNISSTVTYLNNIKTRKLTAKLEMQVTGLPEKPRISNLSWSPNEQFIAFT